MIYTEDTWPSGRWRNFSIDEMKCHHTGICDVDPEFMDNLQLLRTDVNFPITVSSGYRHGTHPIEAAKEKPGTHTTGKAVDIVCYGLRAHRIIQEAHHYLGIGVKQHGPVQERFIHLDTVEAGELEHVTRGWIWSYQ